MYIRLHVTFVPLWFVVFWFLCFILLLLIALFFLKSLFQKEIFSLYPMILARVFSMLPVSRYTQLTENGHV